MNPRQERLGLLCAGLCALNGAFVPAVAKLTTGRAEPVLVAAATSLFGALCAAVVLALRGELRVLTRPIVGPRLVAIAALGTGAAFYLFFLGASRASAIDAVLCLQSEPAYALLLSWLVLGHRPTARRIAAIGVLLAGIALAVGAHGLSGSTGVWILLATPLCWQLSHLIVLRGLVGISPSVLTGARYIHGGILLAFCWLASGGIARMPEATVWLPQVPWLALQGIVLSYGGTLLWYGAITRLDLARSTAIVVPSIPLLSLGASFVILGEVPTTQQWLGLLLTATGVVAFVTAPHAATASA
ncbi:MAG TPA: DMT family transporter [Candidatus Kryptonia bacterium]|nr:DMT family transporter [Candidatus Kryptonia bacterium]